LVENTQCQILFTKYFSFITKIRTRKDSDRTVTAYKIGARISRKDRNIFGSIDSFSNSTPNITMDLRGVGIMRIKSGRAISDKTIFFQTFLHMHPAHTSPY
jgi:hypothetical protein